MLAMRPQNNAGCLVIRNTEAQHGNEARLGGGIVRRFRRSYSLDSALAEALRRARNFLFETVGGECRNGRSPARENPERRSNYGSAHHRWKRLLEIGKRRPYPANRLG